MLLPCSGGPEHVHVLGEIPTMPSFLARAVFIVATCALAVFVPNTRAQTCDPAWLSPGPDGGLPGTDMNVRATTVFDPDGAGAEAAWLVIGGLGGNNRYLAGTTPIGGVAAWNGSTWMNLGTVLSGTNSGWIASLHVHNGELIAGGQFTSIDGVPALNIAAYNGTTWRSFGQGLGIANTSDEVRSIASYNGDLYAGGSFVLTGAGAVVNNLARFDGTTWRSVGGGVVEISTATSVNAMMIFGGDLVIAGDFSNAGEIAAGNIVRWNGVAFLPLAQGVGRFSTDNVNAIAVIGGSLFAGGNLNGFPNGPDNGLAGLAQWNGTQWLRPAPSSSFGSVRTIREYQGVIYITNTLSNTSQVLRWLGTPAGATPLFSSPVFAQINRLEVYGGQLIVAGNFNPLAINALRGLNITTYDGVSFNSLSRGFFGSIANAVPDGDGALFVGSIQFAGNTPVSSPVVRWDGANSWQSFGSFEYTGTVSEVIRYNNTLFMAGSFGQNPTGANNLARWTGSTWDRVGGVSPATSVLAVAVYQNQLYIAGTFGTPEVNIPNIARWNGTAWSPVGTGLNGTVTDLTLYQDRLVAIGNFASSGTTQLRGVGAWNGTQWQALGAGLGASAVPLATAALGNDLFVAGGSFAFPLSTSPIARWNGTQWNPTSNAPLSVTRLSNVDGALYALGTFTSVNSVPCDGLAQWNGASWFVPSIGEFGTFGTTFLGSLSSIGQLADGRVLVTGGFSTAGGNVARGWSTFTPGGSQNFILAQPADFAACPNLAAEFRVVMQNPEAAIYEWRRDGMPLRNGRGISGANSNILTIEGVLLDDAGLYQCRITTACGVVVSREASLSVVAQPNCPKVCDDIDFNNDGSIFDPLDVDSFLSVFSEGPCL
jgi:hypothetical protein